jgi:hypothetical protein
MATTQNQIQSQNIEKFVVKKEDQYMSCGDHSWQFKILPTKKETYTCILRDLYVDLNKNVLPVLKRVFKALGMKAPSNSKKAFYVAALTEKLEFEPLAE